MNIVWEDGGKDWFPFENMPQKDSLITISEFAIEYHKEKKGDYRVKEVQYDMRDKYDRSRNMIFIHLIKVSNRLCQTCLKELSDMDSLTKCHDCKWKEQKEKLEKKRKYEKELGL